MRYRVHEVIGSSIEAADGDVGHIRDFYFDDETWRVRYVVVETGFWLNRREVLLVPTALSGGADGGPLKTALTRQQVRDSPPVMADLPLSRHCEARLHVHYGWLPYWSVPGLPAPPRSEEQEILERAAAGDPHLRSFRDIRGYRVEARDGRIGHVIDALVEPEPWRVSHFALDTRNWLPGRHVVIGTNEVQAIDWGASRMVVDLTRKEVEAAPAFDADPSQPRPLSL